MLAAVSRVNSIIAAKQLRKRPVPKMATLTLEGSGVAGLMLL